MIFTKVPKIVLLFAILLSGATHSLARESQVNLPKKSADSVAKDRLAFDSQLVEGEIYRPDYSVVTGESPGEGWGVLRLRHDFQDHSKTDGEEKKR